MNFENIQLGLAIKELVAQQEKKETITYPANHQPGMIVPEGGSSCESCEYYKGDMKCGSEHFIRWDGANAIPPKPAGSDKIPADAPNKYCSDWYEQKENNESEDDN